MKEVEITVTHAAGLHLRPASTFVQKAASYRADVKIRNVSKESAFQNAKSAMGVMMLKVSQGDTIAIRAAGDDEQDAIAGLTALVESDFEA